MTNDEEKVLRDKLRKIDSINETIGKWKHDLYLAEKALIEFMKDPKDEAFGARVKLRFWFGRSTDCEYELLRNNEKLKSMMIAMVKEDILDLKFRIREKERLIESL